MGPGPRDDPLARDHRRRHRGVLLGTHSSWQLPTNEQDNGVLAAQGQPPLDIHSQAGLDAIADMINHMPRRPLDWQSALQMGPDHFVIATQVHDGLALQ